MNKDEFISLLTFQRGGKKKDSEEFVSDFLKCLVTAAKKEKLPGESGEINLGEIKFRVIKTKDRIASNPKNREEKIYVSGQWRLKMKAGKRINEELNK
jgi:nucleoid DNA-binding protein